MVVYDVIIVGGGPAGLNAAVVLGRCRRNVLLFDSGTQRNRMSHGMHNFLTRDDILPSEFLKICYGEIKKYGIELINKKVTNARKNKDDLFAVTDENGVMHLSKKLLIATGLVDKIPDVPGLKEMYGKSVYHCPYCDGWEVRDKKIGVYAKTINGAELALSLKTWSSHIKLYTDGGEKLKKSESKTLAHHNIEVNTTKISKVEGNAGQIERILFENGNEEDCEAIFFVNGFTQQCDLVDVFGCELSKKGVVITDKTQQTNTPGLYVAGDADKDMHFVIVAAAEGAKAGVCINKELQKESKELPQVK
jgi:thioredoxin reductase